jgi:hypothetical protein
MMSKEINILVMDSLTTKFAQAANVFESFKVAIKPLIIATVIPTFGKDNVDKILESWKGDDKIIAIFSKEDGVYWFDESVKVISNGDQFCLLKDYIGLKN